MELLNQTSRIFLDVVVPVFVLIGGGALLDRCLRPDIRTLSHLNFYVFVPALVFSRILRSELTFADMSRIGGASLALIGVLFSGAFVVSRRLPALRPHSRVLALATSFYNSGNFGIPVAQLAFGDAGAGIMAVFLMVQNFMSFTLGVCLFESRRSFGRMLAGLLTTPVILAIVTAFLLRALRLSPPVQLTIPLEHLANGLIPIALLTLGVQLSRSLFGRPFVPLCAAACGRLLLAPCLALVLARLFGLRGLEAQVFIAGAGFPTAVNVYILASRYEEDAELASRIVFLTTLISSVSVALLLALVSRL